MAHAKGIDCKPIQTVGMGVNPHGFMEVKMGTEVVAGPSSSIGRKVFIRMTPDEADRIADRLRQYASTARDQAMRHR